MVVYYDLGQNNFDRKYKKNLKKICRFKVYEMLGWVKHKIAGRNTNNVRYADDNTLMAESEEELKSLLMKVKEKTEKV